MDHHQIYHRSTTHGTLPNNPFSAAGPPTILNPMPPATPYTPHPSHPSDHWMASFARLQQQQVQVLDKQTENQKLQLAILTKQLEYAQHSIRSNHPIFDPLTGESQRSLQVSTPMSASATPGSFGFHGSSVQSSLSRPLRDVPLQDSDDPEPGDTESENEQDGMQDMSVLLTGALQEFERKEAITLQSEGNGAPGPSNWNSINASANSNPNGQAGYTLSQTPVQPGRGGYNRTFPNQQQKAAFDHGNGGPSAYTPTPAEGKRLASLRPGHTPAASNLEMLSYSDEVKKLVCALPRNALEDTILELAYMDHGNSVGSSGPGAVRGLLAERLHRSRKVADEDVTLSIICAKLWSQHSPDAVGSIGPFARLPLNIVLRILGLLSLRDLLTFVLQICRTFRGLFASPHLWNKVVFEPTAADLSFPNYLRLLSNLPETSIRMLTLDSSYIDAAQSHELSSLITRKKHFNISSLHIVGKKWSNSNVSSVLTRIWSDNITTFSLADLTPSKIDPESVVKNFLPHLPNVTKLRLEGIIKFSTLKLLSSHRGHLKAEDGSRVLGDNRITHLSLVGKNCFVFWDELRFFGRFFPELEELFLACVIGEENSWVRRYAIGPPQMGDLSAASTADGVQGKKFRYPTAQEIEWHPMHRLRYFGVEHIGEPTGKKNVRTMQNVHAAYLWALINGSAQTIQRLEISRGEEVFKGDRRGRTTKEPAGLPMLMTRPTQEMEYPNLQYLYLAYWKVSWQSFVGTRAVSPRDHESRAPPPIAEAPQIVLPGLNKIVFWRCEGVPQVAAQPGADGVRAWVRDLRQVWGEHIQGLDESCGQDPVERWNLGAGNW